MRCLSRADGDVIGKLVGPCLVSKGRDSRFGCQTRARLLRSFGRFASVLALVAFLLPVFQTALQAQEVSDDALYDQVMRVLVRDQSLKIAELAVEVKNGVVTVHGYVKNERLLERVERVAKRPKGVREVVNKVGVRP